jgi:mutator family transposase
MLKAIHTSEDIAAAREKALQVLEKLRALRLTTAAELAAATFEETLSYYSSPEEHWRRIRNNNPLERILREIRRRTRVVGAFPDDRSALNLAAARGPPSRPREILEHPAAEGPADERSHDGLSWRRAPLSPTQKSERLWTLPTGQTRIARTPSPAEARDFFAQYIESDRAKTSQTLTNFC